MGSVPWDTSRLTVCGAGFRAQCIAPAMWARVLMLAAYQPVTDVRVLAAFA